MTIESVSVKVIFINMHLLFIMIIWIKNIFQEKCRKIQTVFSFLSWDTLELKYSWIKQFDCFLWGWRRRLLQLITSSMAPSSGQVQNCSSEAKGWFWKHTNIRRWQRNAKIKWSGGESFQVNVELLVFTSHRF